MAARRKQRDLIERVRYPNPLPDLPYAPKLIRIAPPQPNYESPVFLQRVAESQQLPVAVDAEAGMELDLAKIENLWLEDSSAAFTTNFELDHSQLHEEDAFLLSDELSARPPRVLEENAVPIAQPSDVTWLRRTEYLGAEQRKQRQAENKASANPIDTSDQAQIARIQQGFEAANAALDTLHHPTKPDVHAVESYELLPDPETWATPMHIVRFATALGPTEQDRDVRMETGILRPYSDASGQRVSLYLASGETLPTHQMQGKNSHDEGQSEPASDEEQHHSDTESSAPPIWEPGMSDAQKMRRNEVSALRFMKRRRLGVYPPVPPNPEELEPEPNSSNGWDANEYATAFRHFRDWEPSDQAAALGHELILVLDDGHVDPEPELEQITTSGPISVQTQRLEALNSAGNVTDQATDNLFDAPEDSDPSASEMQADITSTLPPQTDTDRAKQTAVAPLLQNRKVAYYHPIDMRYSLRIRRQRRSEQGQALPYEDFWHRVIVGNRSTTDKERARRMHARAQVDSIDLTGVELEESEEEMEEGESNEEPPEENIATSQDQHETALNSQTQKDGDAGDNQDDDESDQGAVDEDMDQETPSVARHDEDLADKDAHTAYDQGIQTAVRNADSDRVSALQQQGQAVMNAAAQSKTHAGADAKWAALHGGGDDLEQRGTLKPSAQESTDEQEDQQEDQDDDDDDDDATDSDVSDMDADAELAALQEEAQGTNDLIPAEAGRSSRRRPTSGA
ncbi:hypothetical protein MYAM1_002101 [Malassezia yamatoensis]|uniref:RNA polymerase II-associated protein 1 n=1 Tax=Malassezia yamatoensis TaxID=253288 RepID=A0AAJ6CGH0_9BASI|nr:hypothetical protein MYAM1_002101 [Malassezia yamatoensis]